jgi:hypothetical protein
MNEFEQDPEMSAYVQRIIKLSEESLKEGQFNPFPSFQQMAKEAVCIFALFSDVIIGEDTTINGVPTPLNTMKDAVLIFARYYGQILERTCMAILEMQEDPKFIEMKARFATHVAITKMYENEKSN